MIHDFRKKKIYSLGDREKRDISILNEMIPGVSSVTKTTEEEDMKTGVDYIVGLRRGATINIDAKTREKGASKYWGRDSDGAICPELALEIWSVVPDRAREGKVGWTLDESKDLDYILYTFHPEDWEGVFFIPFQLLRKSFVSNYKKWIDRYHLKKQESFDNQNTWCSECVFVPYDVVLDTIDSCMFGY